MHPILFRLGPLPFRAYGLALAVSFLVGSWLALKRGTQRGVSEATLTNLLGWILLSAVVGARLHYVLAHPDQFASPGDAFKIWEGGLTLYGGLTLATLTSWFYLHRLRVPFRPVADIVAPSLALGEGITRIGCLVNGCCFGRACSGPLSIHFPPESYAAQALGSGVGVYPSQLFLSGGLLLVFFLLLRAERLGFKAGGLFGLYLMLQGLVRYVVDFTRYYEPVDRFTATAPILVTHSQLVAVGLIVVGAILFWPARRGRKSTGSAL